MTIATNFHLNSLLESINRASARVSASARGSKINCPIFPVEITSSPAAANIGTQQRKTTRDLYEDLDTSR